jgi:hypothetical protein
MADDDVARFRDLLSGRWVGYALHAAATLGLADAFDSGGPRPAARLAEATGADPRSLERLLRALGTIGLVSRSGDGYELTSLGALLRADSPERLRDQVLFTGGDRALRGWAQFPECVRSGRTAAAILDGIDDPFAWFAERPDQQAALDAAMAEGTAQMAGAIVRAYDFSGIDSAVDVGGGYGALLVPVLHAHPGLTATVFDRPHCEAGARELIAREGLADRYGFSGGDFFADPLPPGAGAYVLKSVIHDWDDERAVAVLRRCVQAMPAGARLLMIEVVLPDRLEPSAEHRRMVWADLNMLVSTGGRERTRSEYEALLAAAGLRITRIVPTDTPTSLSVVEAAPAANAATAALAAPAADPTP